MNPIQLPGGLVLEPVCADGVFKGFGNVTLNGLPLRSSRLPWGVELRSPEGVRLTDLVEVSRVALPDGGVRLTFAGTRRRTGQMDWMLHTIKARVDTADWTVESEPDPASRVELELHPVTRRFGTADFTGFSYRWHLIGKDFAIYRLADRGSWEPHGHAVGNTLWLRNGFMPSVTTFTGIDQRYTTEWFVPGAHNPSIFQFSPLQTCHQGFTFTAAADGVLLTWANQIAHIRSLYEKHAGKDELVHWHEHCGDLASDFTTATMEVLWTAGTRTREQTADLWLAVYEQVATTLHTEVGMQRERITTYGIMEEWGVPKVANYTEKGLPKLQAAGVKTFFIPNWFQNNMNTYGAGNMCCTVDWRWAHNIPQPEIKRFASAIKAGGGQLQMWANTAISTLSTTFAHTNRDQGPQDRVQHPPWEGSVIQRFKDTPSAWIRNPSGHLEADHYAPVFALTNLREPVVTDYWHERWQEAAQTGISGIFLDSSFNLSSDKWHWRPNPTGTGGATADQAHLLGHFRPVREPPAEILSQYKAHLALVVKMQSYGIHYCGEDAGVFGTHRTGPGVEARVDCLDLWADCLCSFDAPALRKMGKDPADIYFRALAHRMMWSLCWVAGKDELSWQPYHVNDESRPTESELALLRAYAQVDGDLRERTLLPKDAGVLWRNGTTQVLWAFRDQTMVVPAGATVTDVLAGTTSTTPSTLVAAKHRIYRIDG